MKVVRPAPRLVLGGLSVLLFVALLCALMTGATGFGPGALWTQPHSEAARASWLVISQIRAPRAVMALLTGAALAASGAVMQGMFRNPLADPGLTGVSSGAALGAALVIVLGNAGAGAGFVAHWAVPAGGITGALASTVVLYLFAARGGVSSPTLIILAGVALSAFAGALTGILVFRANDTALRDLTFWTMGSLSGAAWPQIGVLLPVLLPAAFIMGRIAGGLNVLLLGDEDAALTGCSVGRIRRLAMLCVALACGPIVSFVGVIGFVGVVVPHLVRLVSGPDHRILLPASALLGAALLLVADTLARVIAIPSDVPVGVVTAAIGAPVFVWQLARSQQTGRFS
ncbi:MAG: iron ABC transporter permease [Acetobacter papayae]|uniref:FecCD family ABC transporter permease n=1 Tax=Acetobacter papayae TaxID=1076592 RepID=UPI0039E9565A